MLLGKFMYRVESTAAARVSTLQAIGVSAVVIAFVCTITGLLGTSTSHPENVELTIEGPLPEKDVVGLVLLLQFVVDPLEIIEL